MKPTDQTVFGYPDGNCLNACLASLLDLEIEQVPHFGDAGWHGRLNDWLRSRGMYTLCFALPEPDSAAPPGLHILSGKSPRGDYLHAVVAEGQRIVHDPHPTRAGLLTREDVLVLIPYDPAAPCPSPS